jgi:tRNA threonylcarbamoyl adenosine modification protein YeaZ
MNILALEFSSAQRGVAVVQTGSHSQAQAAAEVIETGEQAMRALAMIEEALRQAGIEREQIECIAVGLGPGSYTGIRSAIALAQGWQIARPIKVLGISSAECIAAQAEAENLAGRAAVIIDAQRGEFYLSNYELGSGLPQERQPLRLARREQAEECATFGQQIIGPEATRWFRSARSVFPRAAMIAQLAAGRTDYISAEGLEPIYLRQTAFVKAPLPRQWPGEA